MALLANARRLRSVRGLSTGPLHCLLVAFRHPLGAQETSGFKVCDAEQWCPAGSRMITSTPSYNVQDAAQTSSCSTCTPGSPAALSLSDIAATRPPVPLLFARHQTLRAAASPLIIAWLPPFAQLVTLGKASSCAAPSLPPLKGPTRRPAAARRARCALRAPTRMARARRRARCAPQARPPTRGPRVATAAAVRPVMATAVLVGALF